MINEYEKKLETYMRGYVEVNLDNIVYNMKSMKANINEKTLMTAVIKADGYGHGSVPIARVLEPLDFISGFATATCEEAYILKKSGITKPIIVIGYTFSYSYEMMIKEEIRITVFRYDMIEQISEAARRVGKKAKVHIKVDTGMGRIGISPNEEGLKFIEKLVLLDGIEIEGIFTHFARADEYNKDSANAQLKKFNDFINMIRENIFIDNKPLEIPIKHCSNSAGILELPDANMDMVRAGITLYGLYPSDEVSRETVPLRPALSLFSHIIYVKTLHANESVSYGGTFTADKDMLAATIPLGYADGYPRSLSNKGYVLIKGKRARILGRVCMDQFVVDVTDIEGVREGDLVTLIGYDNGEHISAEDIGEISGRFNYELVCGLSKRLPRVYISDGKISYTKDYTKDYE